MIQLIKKQYLCEPYYISRTVDFHFVVALAEIKVAHSHHHAIFNDYYDPMRNICTKSLLLKFPNENIRTSSFLVLNHIKTTKLDEGDLLHIICLGSRPIYAYSKYTLEIFSPLILSY